MDLTETFQEEDQTTLTAEERKEAEQLQRDERLRRSDPIAYSSLMARRRQSQAKPPIPAISTDQQFNSGGQLSWAPLARQETFSSHFDRTNTMWQTTSARPSQVQDDTEALELERQRVAGNVAATTAASGSSQANLSPILSGNTTTLPASLENASSSVAAGLHGLSINPIVCIPKPYVRDDEMLETLLIDSTTFINQAK